MKYEKYIVIKIIAHSKEHNYFSSKETIIYVQCGHLVTLERYLPGILIQFPLGICNIISGVKVSIAAVTLPLRLSMFFALLATYFGNCELNETLELPKHNKNKTSALQNSVTVT